MKNKLGISIMTSHKDKCEVDEQIRIFSECGFDSFFLSCGVTEDFGKIIGWSEIAKKNKIQFEAVHAPSGGVDSVWMGDGEEYIKRIMDILDLCSEAEVDKLVMHAALNPDVQISDAGREGFRKIENYAKHNGVHICYENAVSVAQVRALLADCEDFHGFCYDTGHHFCYTPQDDIKDLTDKHIMYTHIHDNLGKKSPDENRFEDMHLLPYDGSIVWEDFCKSIESAEYTGTLNLELSCNNKKEYNTLSYADFVKEGYKRISKIRENLKINITKEKE